MFKSSRKSALAGIFAAASAICAPAVLADALDYTYEFVDGPGTSKPYAGTSNGDYNDDVDSIDITSVNDPDLDHVPGLHISAWYGEDLNDKILDEALFWETYGGGIGITSTSGDGHTVDNRHDFDYLALAFDSPVTLEEVTLGYVDGDSDFSVFYQNQSGLGNGYDFKTDAADGSISLNDGFELARHFYNAPVDVAQQVNVAYKSPVWLIAAYSPVLGGHTGYVNKSDKFKVETVLVHKMANGGTSGNGGVPVPATFALMGIGGLMLRKRSKR